MALVVKDRVKVLSTSTGQGTFTLGAAYAGYQSFSAIGDGNVTYYCINNTASGVTEWEVGIGTYTSSGTTLSRDTVLSNSLGTTAKIDFGAGDKEVFCTYPSEKAIYEEPNGDTLINAGPITVLGPSVTSIPSVYPYTLGRFYGNEDSYEQIYVQNQYDGTEASADIVAYNNLGDGTNYFIDMGISGSSYSSASYPLFTENSGYVFNSGLTTGTGQPGEISELFVGTGTLNSDLVLFTGGVDTVNEAVRISGADQSIEIQKGVTINETLDVTGAASFGDTVLLGANPTLALQAATKQYVDNATSTGIHIHEQIYVEKDTNLAGNYVQGGTTFNITDITGTNTVTTSTTHGLSVNDQIWLYNTAGNGLSTNTAYFVYATPAGNQLQLSTSYGGPLLTGLTNASGLVYNTRANSGVGAYLEAASNAVLPITVPAGFAALAPGDRVLVYKQTNSEENGVYVVTDLGSLSSKWKLTRASDANFYSPQDTNGLGEGDYFFITTISESYVLTTPGNIIIGYTGLTYTLFSAATTYTGTSPIDVTGSVISLTTVPATLGGTGTSTVDTGDLLYGSGTNTWSKLTKGAAYQALVMNGSGTNVEWNSINLSSTNAVTGTLPATYGGTGQTAYATGDMLYSSATNTLSKLAGNTSTSKLFLSQTGTGSASQAPSWDSLSASDITSGTLGATRGGTGYGSYAVGDILYADTTTSLAKLADVATGNVLLSGGVSTAPSWGKVDLTAAVSGTLPTGNGGTGLTSFTANKAVYSTSTSALTTGTLPISAGGTNTTDTPTAGGIAYGTGTAYAITTAGTSNQVLLSGGAGAPTFTNQSSLSVGSATTATTATNLAGGGASQIPYQTGAGTTSFIANGTSGQVLTSNGSSAPSWQTSSGATKAYVNAISLLNSI